MTNHHYPFSRRIFIIQLLLGACFLFAFSGCKKSDTIEAAGNSVQCSGETLEKKRCKRMTTHYSGRCYQH